MANVTLQGNPIRGRAPQDWQPGSQLPCHSRRPQRNISLADFEGKVEFLNIVPSLDTGLGAASARRFEKEAGRPRPAHDTTFVEGLDRAFYWQRLIDEGIVKSGSEIARREG
jgi:peroxiredoxin